MNKVSSPIYLLRSSESCWKCGAVQEVVALATRHLHEDDPDGDETDTEDEPIILDNISEMPQEVLDYIRAVHPRYEKRTSKTMGSAYYMNTCSCGAHFGDFYLYSEPGGAFFPDTEEQASHIAIEELPLTGTFDLECGYGVGIGSFIFEHAKRRRRSTAC